MNKPSAEERDVTTYWAHTANASGDWHELNTHLTSTAEIATAFGRTCLEKNLFRYAALVHDAGKYQKGFQEYLRHGGVRGSVPHAAHGAALAYKRTRQNAVIFAVLGHHQGLLDQGKTANTISGMLSNGTLAAVEETFLSSVPNLKELEAELDTGHRYQKQDNSESELFIRYLFSALTDADWLDTESHFSLERQAARIERKINTDELIAKLEKCFGHMRTDGPINSLRNKVRHEVASQADLPVGFFSLNVPTGLGKTLTSTYWALRHAKANNLRRVIIVLPFVNIIDQTAKTLSQIFGEDFVLEHHSGAFDDIQNIEQDGYNPKILATENWDYPIIVTTTVQFFESLFSNKPSKCRKIHNIADAVVIFDEVQALKQELVIPSLEMLQQVQDIMKTSFLFCTATQPAFEKSDNFAGIENITPLIANPRLLFETTKRVEYKVLDNFKPVNRERLISSILDQDKSVLVVLNTKKDAKGLYEAISSTSSFDSTYHLSTNMCPQHRKAEIQTIIANLNDGKKILVVSTQLIEAGVDVDFPYVYRALAPLESIIQAAGRCNREGRRALGEVYLFALDGGGMPPGLYATCAEHAKQLILSDTGFLDRHDAFTEYYRQVQNLFVKGDKYNVCTSRKQLLFEQVASSYRLIDTDTVPIIIGSYGKCASVLKRLRSKPIITRHDLRSLQPYMVNAYRQMVLNHSRFIDQKTIPGLLIWEGKYDRKLGLITDDFSAEELIV